MQKVLKQQGIAVLVKSHILRGCTYLSGDEDVCGKLTNYYIKCDRASPHAWGLRFATNTFLLGLRWKF